MISKIDKNFKVETSLKEDNLVFFDVREQPFKVYGLYNHTEPGKFKRLPESVAQNTSAGVSYLNYNTAGGRVRFKTASKYVAIKAVMESVCLMGHMPLCGSAGFDLYINRDGKSTYFKTFVPPVGMKDGYENIIYFDDRSLKNITINFPLYNDVKELYIGVEKDSELQEGGEYRYTKPVVFYGSSITQGGCASRPGNCYPAIISRNLDCDYINLGFSGSARAEDAITEYLAALDMSIFVCDYDHNAPSAEYLQSTHEKLYKRIREARSDLPIILISKPDFENGLTANILRRDVVYNTYINGIKNGDKNLYYIDGKSLFQGEGRDCCTVDGCHPNDLGFYRMADIIGNVIKGIL